MMLIVRRIMKNTNLDYAIEKIYSEYAGSL